MREFYDELRRRRLFGTLALYLIGAWGVLQLADVLFPGWEIPESSIRFVWTGVALLFPIAIVFSWRYDVSPDGVRRTPARSGTGPPPLGRFDFGLLSVLALLSLSIGAIVTARVLETRYTADEAGGATEVPRNSIAVLPFVDMSEEPGNEYFSDGITEQLLNELSRLPELHVAARTSSFHFKARNEDVRTIGRELGVRTLLEGSVRRTDRRLRITAQLIDAETGFHLWSQSFDREPRDIFDVQDEIATAIVDTLRLRLRARDATRLHRPATTDPVAFDLYLQAMDTLRGRGDDAILRSNALLTEAIDRAPDFALAYAELAYGQVLEAWYGRLDVEEATFEVLSLLERALAIDPDLEQAYGARGLLHLLRRENEEANSSFEHALELNPGYYGAHVNYGLALVRQGRLKEASASYLRAQTLDPMNASLNHNLGALMMLMGEFEGGAFLMRRAGELEPRRTDIDHTLAHWHYSYGRLAESLAISERVYAEQPENLYNAMILAGLKLDAGMFEATRRILAAARRVDARHKSVLEIEKRLWLAEGDLEAVHRRAAEEFRAIDALQGEALSRRDAERVLSYAWTEIVRGDYASAVKNLDWAIGGEAGLAAMTYDEMEPAKLLAVAHRRLGRHDESAELAEHCLELADAAHEQGWATPQFFYRVAEIHASQNDLPRALEYLERAYGLGWREAHLLEHRLYWEELRPSPELEDLELKVREDIRQQLLVDTAFQVSQP